MDPNLLFLLFGTSAVLAFGVYRCLSQERLAKKELLMGSLAMLAISLISNFLQPQRNVFFSMLTLSSINDRSALATYFIGLSMGTLCGIAAAEPATYKNLSRIKLLLLLFTLLSLGLLSAKDKISPYLSRPGDAGKLPSIEITSNPLWSLTRVIELNLAPTSICVDNSGKAYVAGYLGAYGQNGGVKSVTYRSDNPKVQLSAIGLTRPHGVAWREGNLFVSRAGQHTVASGGQLIEKSTGAVTRLTDVDQDGVYDLFHDIISNLPGPKLPDGLHQNNGIAFNAAGELFITVGNPTNAAPARDSFEGTILRTDGNGNNPVVFASGFRNPFGICATENDLYCTDNDPNGTELGDELNLVRQGEHYGHPYDAMDGLHVTGTISPLMRMESAQGLASIPKKYQESLGGDLMVADYSGNAIRVINAETKSSTFFAKLNSVVSIAIDADGTVLGCSYGEKTLYVFKLISDGAM